MDASCGIDGGNLADDSPRAVQPSAMARPFRNPLKTASAKAYFPKLPM